MEKIIQILSGFDPIQLDEMDNVKLMDRVDRKFTFHISHLPMMLQELKEDYFALNIDGFMINQYENIYFDTEDYHFYLQHHNGKRNRKKVRIRRYSNTGVSFFEVKIKNNKGYTIKERIRKKQFSTKLGKKSSVFLQDKFQINPELLEPSIKINFSRITLVDKKMKERLTFDTHLCFQKLRTEKTFDNLVIGELKQNRSERSIALEVFKKYHIYNISISKYCLGIASLVKGIKQNAFKPSILTLNKIMHEKDQNCIS